MTEKATLIVRVGQRQLDVLEHDELLDYFYRNERGDWKPDGPDNFMLREIARALNRLDAQP